MTFDTGIECAVDALIPDDCSVTAILSIGTLLCRFASFVFWAFERVPAILVDYLPVHLDAGVLGHIYN